MPEHVTVAESTGNNGSVTDYPTLPPQGHLPSKPRFHERRRVHAYEQVEESFTGDPAYSDFAPTKASTLKSSVKRSDHWSPGLPKHPKDKSRYDKAHAKSTTIDRSEANQENAVRKKRPGSSRSKKSSVSEMDVTYDAGRMEQHQREKFAESNRGSRRSSKDSREWSPQEAGVSDIL